MTDRLHATSGKFHGLIPFTKLEKDYVWSISWKETLLDYLHGSLKLKKILIKKLGNVVWNRGTCKDFSLKSWVILSVLFLK